MRSRSLLSSVKPISSRNLLYSNCFLLIWISLNWFFCTWLFWCMILDLKEYFNYFWPKMWKGNTETVTLPNTFLQTGHVVHKASNKCLDRAFKESMDDVVVAECANSITQQWWFDHYNTQWATDWRSGNATGNKGRYINYKYEFSEFSGSISSLAS